MKDDISLKSEYMTTQQAAEKWNISDRRVRVLCGEGRIKGAVKQGKSYLIPADADKPADGREKPAQGLRYLKWDNDIVGTISGDNAVILRNRLIILLFRFIPVGNCPILMFCELVKSREVFILRICYGLQTARMNY